MTTTTSNEREHGLRWKIYFVLFVLVRVVDILFPDSIWKVPIFALHAFVASSVLYSWIWGRRIEWLRHIRWLVKLWSIQFFIAPIALVVWGFVALTQQSEEAFGWVITVVLNYPALYIVWRIAWKSKLLHRV